MNPRDLMNENQRRVIRIALTALDQFLCEVQSLVEGRESHGILYNEIDDLTLGQKDALSQRVRETRKLLLEIREQLGLESTERRASVTIWGQCCTLRDTMSELRAKHMKGYGQVPPTLGRYFDGISAALVGAIDRLAEEAGKTQKRSG